MQSGVMQIASHAATGSPASMPRLVAIVAMDGKRVIGKDGRLPWHHPEDLKFFKRTTLGHPILMGRKTFESIGRPLPGRANIVLSRTMEAREGVSVIRNIADLPALFPSAQTVFLIGGAQLFQELLPQCEAIYLTMVEGEHDGDVFLPPFEHLFGSFKVVERAPGLEFRYYERG